MAAQLSYRHVDSERVNRTKLRSDLTTYATNLASYIRTNMPLAGVSDVVGGGTIVPTPFANGVTVRQTSNPNQDSTVTPTVTATIPSEYFATLSVTVPGAAAQTFNSFDIYGHRLSIFFDTTFTPTLYLDGVAQVSGSSNISKEIPGANSGERQHPVVSRTFADQQLTQYVTAESNANNAGYVVATGWDQVGRGMIEKHRGILHQAINSGAASNSELVLGRNIRSVIGLHVARAVCRAAATRRPVTRHRDAILSTAAASREKLSGPVSPAPMWICR
jgi:hypothetical protein